MRADLPRIYAGARRGLVWRLIANGLGQAVALLLSALLLHGIVSPSNPSLLASLCLAGCGALILALRVHAAGVAERLGQDYVTRVRLRIFEAISARPDRAGLAVRAGVAMSRVISDLGSLRAWVSEGVARVCSASVTLAASIGVIASLQPSAGLVLVAVSLAGACLAWTLVPRLRRNVREARSQRGRLANDLGERLLAAQAVRLLGRTRAEMRRVRARSRLLRDALVRRARTAEALNALPELLTPAALVSWIWIGGALDVRELAAGVLLLGVLGASLRDLARAVAHRLAFEEGRGRIAALLSGPRLRESRRAKPLEGSGPVRIELQDVSLAGVFEGVTVSADAGSRVLVSGPAGQGKSTLLALAARLFDPDSGRIRIDATPVRRVSLDSLRASLQLVSPDVPLLRGTVLENIVLGARRADSEWIEQVTRACALDGEPSLASGLASRVEERGANLSAGVRARVALARALVMRPRLLLVDDPAFASDAGTGAALRRGCELIAATVLVVGPDDSALLDFDVAWRVAGGRIVARPVSATDSAPRASQLATA